MDHYSQEELYAAIKTISTTISKCEKAQLAFSEGTVQYSLLRNRIKALYIARASIENDNSIDMFTLSDLEKALPPILSIISKTEKVRVKVDESRVQFKRIDALIRAMNISKVFITNEISKRKL